MKKTTHLCQIYLFFVFNVEKNISDDVHAKLAIYYINTLFIFFHVESIIYLLFKCVNNKQQFILMKVDLLIV